ncbi:ribose-phosphate diphosphokinase [Stratiformator vulcanicus]|uniref:ribose-phosphate diphosphokinase n=1 Tax=Stratiformator vulcanicus TaxID=2527980 RepID=A0A517R0A3_9PLAN|nr:ribose-phosphate pyrophosphokinase [Stratiformator vulcanicus]QDT37335.1 Ribose-phosphate pyrophosphokinase [Stratiformator vulcanicus]
MNNFRLFGLEGSRRFAQRVAKYLDVPVSKHREDFFADRETYARSEVNVRASDVYVISSLYADKDQSVPEKMVKLLFFVGSLVDASARRITVVCPYLAFARQDRKTESRAPISIKYLAQCLEAVGANRVLTMDIHNLSAFQNAFRIPTDNLEAKNLLADYLCGVDSGRDSDGVPQPVETHLPDPLINNPDDLVVLAPDSGGMGRAKRFRNALEERLQLHNKIDVAYLDKERMDGSNVSGSKIIGDVKGKRIILLDDMISSGGTVRICVEAVKSHKAEMYAVCATHGLFVGGNVEKNLADVPRLVITDTIRPFRLKQSKWENRLFVIPTSMMFAQAIRRTHEEGGSISDLLQ